MTSAVTFEDFEAIEVKAEETTIFLRRFGSGPAVLLLHGFPQTHVMWRSTEEHIALSGQHPVAALPRARQEGDGSAQAASACAGSGVLRSIAALSDDRRREKENIVAACLVRRRCVGMPCGRTRLQRICRRLRHRRRQAFRVAAVRAAQPAASLHACVVPSRWVTRRFRNP
jgi:hypothetical protein